MDSFKSELKCPTYLKADKKVPVVVTLHGMGSNYLNMRPLVALFGEQTIELHLQGAIPWGNGFAYYAPWFYKFPETQLIGRTAERIYHEVKQILIENQLQEHPLAFIGFSQGAVLTTVSLILHPNWIKAAIIFSGRLPAFAEKWAQRNLGLHQIKTAVFISQGEKDLFFPSVMGEKLNTFFKKYGSQTAFQQYPIGHAINLAGMHDAYEWLNKLDLTKR
jgi:phospholipase/carboxylesterase